MRKEGLKAERRAAREAQQHVGLPHAQPQGTGLGHTLPEYAESVSTADVSTVFSGETNNTLAREMRIAGLKAESRAEREAQQQQHQNNASSTEEEEEGFPETIQAGAKRRVSEAVKAAAAGRPRITQDGHRRRVRFTSDETKELQRLVAVHGTSECNCHDGSPVRHTLSDFTDWGAILRDGALVFVANQRTDVDLKDRWRSMSRRGDPMEYEEHDDGSFDPQYVEQVETAAAAAAASRTHDHQASNLNQVTAADLEAFEHARNLIAEMRAAKEARAVSATTNRRVRTEWTKDENLALIRLYETHGSGEYGNGTAHWQCCQRYARPTCIRLEQDT